MLLLLLVIANLVPVIWCQAQVPCYYGGELCFCKVTSIIYYNIVCNTSRSEPSILPAEFGSFNLTLKYMIVYKYKNIPRIGANSSLSALGLKLESLELPSNNIRTIEPTTFDQIASSMKTLDLSDNRLVNLDFLISLCDLSSIDLGYNNIEYLDASWFKCKAKLQKISMINNSIRIVGSKMFSGFARITTINLKYNQIEVFESEAFAHMPALTSLIMCSSKVTQIQPFAFLNLSSLSVLSCLDNQYIEALAPYSFVGLSKLNYFYLNGNRLTALVKNTFVGLDGMTKLELENNLLREIESDVFSQMPRLQTLDISNNFLTKITKGIFNNLKNLANLYLNQNQIEKIEQNSLLDSSASLKELNLGYNKLSFIKKSYFAGLKSLAKLNLSSNQISSIELGAFDDTVALIHLFMNDNCIFSVHPDMFNNLRFLNYLNLSSNVIIKLHPTIFRNLSRLFQLNLDNNQISALPTNILKYLKGLNILDLSNNMLRRLDDDSQLFQGLNSIRILRFSNNLIERISFQSMLPFKKTLTHIYFDSNRLIEVEPSEGEVFTALQVIDFSSNRNLKHSVRLMNSLENCSQCNYQFIFRNMSGSFIKGLIQYLSTSPPLAFQIKSLNLSHNDLRSLFDLIPFSAMKSKLIGLHLKKANINSSFSILKDLKSIVELDLSDNQIALSKEYFNSNVTKIVYLSNTGITNIQTELGLLPFVIDLDLSRNLIEVVRMGDFSYSLLSLNLSHNRIRLIEDLTFTMDALNMLDLSHNLLTNLSNSHFNLTTYSQLRLYLNNNKLKSFSFERQVDQLALQDNMLVEMVSHASSLTMYRNNVSLIRNIDESKYLKSYLAKISLSHNQITQIEDYSFFYFNRLLKLDLSMNLLSNISSTTFIGPSGLEFLNLSSNLIEFINQDSFQPIKKLIELDLNNNNIKFIMEKSYIYSFYLQKLYLDSLEMENITNSTLEGLKSIKLLTLTSVQFESTENLRFIINSLPKTPVSQNKRYTWYSCTNIEYTQPVIKMNTRYCSMVLFFARKNILINLLLDSGLGDFVSVCRSFSFFDLEYSKSGFE